MRHADQHPLGISSIIASSSKLLWKCRVLASMSLYIYAINPRPERKPYTARYIGGLLIWNGHLLRQGIKRCCISWISNCFIYSTCHNSSDSVVKQHQFQFWTSRFNFTGDAMAILSNDYRHFWTPSSRLGLPSSCKRLWRARDALHLQSPFKATPQGRSSGSWRLSPFRFGNP